MSYGKSGRNMLGSALIAVPRLRGTGGSCPRQGGGRVTLQRKGDARMALDPKQHADWEISRDAESRMKTVSALGREFGLEESELLPYGHYMGKIDYRSVLARLEGNANGKYVDVTAITPTPLGEGKSTTTIGLVQGLGRRGRRCSAAIRQPSGGPTMGVKGSAAGGGLSQCIPLTQYSLGFTGDINAVMNAHNLAMVALTARMQHERNYDDETLLRLSGMERLNIDPTSVNMGWVMDFCCQALRNVIIGIDGVGGKSDGFMMRSRFDIAVSSEVMAILAVAKDLKDLRRRMGRIILARDRHGKPVTTADLQVDGAMTAWMRNCINPTMCYTVEHQPVLIHAGPFANIAIGQSSVIGDRLALKLFDYHVTESGFAADIGFEKFWNVKSRLSGLTPNVSVLVATIRALKMHGGGPTVVAGRPLPEEYTKENLGLLEKGTENLFHHVETIKKSGIVPVVCINQFYTDTEAEIALLRKLCAEKGVRCALSNHWRLGGEGAIELAETVADACEESNQIKFLYPLEMPLRERVEKIAKEVYGADGVDWAPLALEKAKRFESDPKYADYCTMMVKTHLSLSHEPSWKGVPKGWRLPIRDILEYGGAKFLCPMADTISMMPGTSSDPAYRRIDVDTDTGKVSGLF